MTRVVMIDLETLGTVADATIVSIGAVSFMKEYPYFDVKDSLYVPIKLAKTVTADAATLAWWMKQSDEVRAVFNDPNITPLAGALVRLRDFCEGADEVWSKGADFDIAILQQAYSDLNVKTPWSYKATRCFRTMEALYPDVPKPEGYGSHNALLDAEFQARHLFYIYSEHTERNAK